MCTFIPSYITNHILTHAAPKVREAFLSAYSEKPEVSILSDMPPSHPASNGSRWVHDAQSQQALPGKLVRKERDKETRDKQVDDAWEFSGLTRKMYKDVFGRDSIDGKGHNLIATVHYGKHYPNAFFNGTQIAFGDGDKVIFQPFTIIDVIGHEWSHGVVHHSAGLIYRNQSGALNESFADVFGICVKQRVLGQDAKDANWIIGEGIFMPEINGVGIRNMLHPGSAFQDPSIGKDKQPDHMKDIYTGPEDGGGVHINSGIINKVFATYSINVGGKSYDKPVKIWYETLTTKLRANSNFQHMADSLQEVVIQNYGTGIEHKALKEALRSVGLQARPTVMKQMGY